MLTSTSCDFFFKFFFSIRPTDRPNIRKRIRRYLNSSACIISEKGIVQQILSFSYMYLAAPSSCRTFWWSILKIVPKAHIILFLNSRLTGRPLLWKWFEMEKKKKKKKALYLSVNVLSTKVLIEDTIFTSHTGDGTAILRGHPSNAKVWPFAAGQR